jgi:hypothetical protein
LNDNFRLLHARTFRAFYSAVTATFAFQRVACSDAFQRPFICQLSCSLPEPGALGKESQLEGGCRGGDACWLQNSWPALRPEKQKAWVANSSGSLLLTAIESESTLPPQKRVLQKLTVAQRIRPHRFTYEKCPPGRHKLRSSTLVRRQTFPLRKCVKQFFSRKDGEECAQLLYLHARRLANEASQPRDMLAHALAHPKRADISWEAAVGVNHH